MARPISTILFPVFNLLFGLFGLVAMSIGTLNTVRALITGEGESLGGPVWWSYVTAGISFVSLVGTLSQMVGSVFLLMLRERGRVWCVNTSLLFLVMGVLFGPISAWMSIQQQWEIVQAQFNPVGNGGVDTRVIYVSMIAGAIGGLLGSLAYSGMQAYLLSRPRVKAACQGRLATNVTLVEAQLARQPMPEFGERSAEAAANPFASPLAAPDPMFAAPVETASQPSAIETLIPVRNGQALASYYLGLFSLLPLLGFPMGAVAVVLGLRGLARYREQPEVRGRTHAWVGIVCGSVFGLFNLALVAMVVLGIVAAVVTGRS